MIVNIKIKKLLRKLGGRCIIVEKGKPAYVITTFEDYEDLINGKIKRAVAKKDLTEKVNRESAALREEVLNKKLNKVEEESIIKEPSQSEEEIEEIKVEDIIS